MTKQLLSAYSRINDGLAFGVTVFTSALVAVIVVAPFLAATVRYWTGQGYDWLAEMPPQLVPWVVFPMVGVLLRRERHIAVDIVPHFLSGRALNILRALVMTVSFAGCAVFAIYGVSAVAFFARLGQLSTTEIEFPLWVLYVSYPVGFFLACSFCLEGMLQYLTGTAPQPRTEPELQGLIQ